MATSTVGLVNNWFPPNRENYETILAIWKWFPLVSFHVFFFFSFSLLPFHP